MYLNKINFSNFRNLESLPITFQKRVSVFEGDNGQGKTNIAEAISLCSYGKSFRTTDPEHLVKKGKESFFVEASLTKNDVLHKIKYKFDGANSKKKSIEIDEKRASQLKTFQLMPVILFSPESLSIIKEGPENRRNIIDETVLLKDSENIKTINDYKKILKTKNRILRQYKKEEMNYQKALDLLHSINEVFYNCAMDLIKKRFEIIEKIAPLFEEVFNEMSHQNVDISVQYVSSEQTQNLDEITNTLRNKLEQRLTAEMAVGSSLVGPHRHDILFSFDSNDSRYYCSQGQQRALILAFKLTQILYHRHVYGYYPILVLDDVLSELDRDKRRYFINFLNSNPAQTFLTTTDLEKTEVTKNLDIEIFKVKNGAIL